METTAGFGVFESDGTRFENFGFLRETATGLELLQIRAEYEINFYFWRSGLAFLRAVALVLRLRRFRVCLWVVVKERLVFVVKVSSSR